ncbi:hypothetical protein CY35_02G201800 [Sphagnum magellanicum]|nr:hypothetical protein CY35_02G201800 [Sphagnum magellanicum]
MQYPFPMAFFEEFCYIAVPGSLCSLSSFAALNTSSYSWLHQKIPRHCVSMNLKHHVNWPLAFCTSICMP